MPSLSPNQIAYQAYLKSDHWRSLKLQSYRVWGRKCFICRKGGWIDQHHIKYRWPWTDGIVADIRPCCRDCHKGIHDKKITPTQKQLNRTAPLRFKAHKKWHKKHKNSHQKKKPQFKYVPTIWYNQPKPNWVKRGNSSN